MTLLLAIETATNHASLAVGSPDLSITEAEIEDARTLSRTIEVVTTTLLADGGYTPKDLTGIVIADGPGSFTGLRIGTAFAKGLCRALGVPLLAAPSMLGAAWRAAAALASPSVLVEYDALRGDVFRAVYRFGAEGAVDVVQAPALVAKASLPGLEGVFVRASESDASAAALLALTGAKGGPAAVDDPLAWQPAYGRAAEAEAKRLAREGRGAAH